MNIKKEIENLIQNSLQDLKINYSEIKITHPDFLEHGDFTFNVLPLAKRKGVDSRELAKQICISLEKNLPESIENIQIAGAGFLNFFFSKRFYKDFLLQKELKKINILKNKLFLAEHTDPNLFKEFHIGHVMTNTIGESIGRVAKFCGAEVKHVTFQGDVGLHVAKTIFGIKNSESIGEYFPNKSDDIFKKQNFLGKCYVYGNKKYEETEEYKKEIIEINKKIYSREDQEQNKIYDLGKEWSLKYCDYIYEILGSKFDYYFLESNTFEDGQKIVEENIGKVFQKSQGAIIFPGSEYGLHDRVFINSEKLPTYEAKDIGLFYKKWKKYNPDISMTVTSLEQKQYFQVVKKAAGMLNKDWEEKTVHLAHGELKLPTGKMSSRKGNIVRAKDWIEDWQDNILKKMTCREVENKKAVAQKIAISAIKYSILKSSVGRDIIYDENKALDFSGNSGPYLQYSYVRAKAILEKVSKKEKKIHEREGEVSNIEKKIYRFEEVIEKSMQDFSPHHIANFLHDLAKEFNFFYTSTKVLDEKNSDYLYNIILVEKFSQIMKKGLELLGLRLLKRCKHAPLHFILFLIYINIHYKL